MASGMLGFMKKRKADKPSPSVMIRIEKARINASLAKSYFQKARGLMLRPVLKENEGMLFDFKTESFPSMWMFGMRFPIDILWLDMGFRIVHIEKSCSPKKFWKIYSTKKKARYVLEVKSGFCESVGINEGQYAHFC